MIDSHCHLADKKFNADREEVVARAHAEGIDRMICIADSLEEGEQCLSIANQYDSVFCTVGVHPHVAKDWKDGDREKLTMMLQSSKKVCAVGEIGLDYHYDNSPRDVQQSVFRIQLELAQELDLPAVIHNRNSIDDMMEIIDSVNPKKAVLHCCTEKWDDVASWVERGYFLSFTGIATYPQAEDIRETIKHCPLEQMMIETDAPYLAPVPHRGKRNEPAFVKEVAKLIAGIKQLSLDEIAEKTEQNTVEFFSLPL